MKRIAAVLAVLTLAASAVAVAQQQTTTPAPEASVPWQKHKQSQGDAPTLEFQAGQPKQLTCELQFDGFENRNDNTHVSPDAVRECPNLPGVDATTQPRPPKQRALWGNGRSGLPGVTGNADTHYTAMDPAGQNARAAADADAHGKSKGGDDTIEAPLVTHQKQWEAHPFQVTPSDDDDSDNNSGGH